MILENILQQKRDMLRGQPKYAFEKLCQSNRSFLEAIGQPGLSVIGELKRKSPSQGILCAQYDPAGLSQRYEEGGAAALSVLTDAPFFGGSFADLQIARTAVKLPVLCKDFIIDESQIHRARLAGADAVLLIMRILSLEEASALKLKIESFNMLALIEVFDEADLAKALQLSPQALMFNQRDLDTLRIEYDRANALLKKVPVDIPCVMASGVRQPAEVLQFDPRIEAVLIGTSLIQAVDPVNFIREIKSLTCHLN